MEWEWACNMRISFFPDNYVNSVYDIDFNVIKKLGFTSIIFDIDNTLVEHGAKANKKAINLFNDLREKGFKTCLISNNYKQRVDIFNEDIHSLYVYEAKKPSKKGFRKALSLLNASPSDAVFIGDQIFTDVFGAKRVGIYSILSKPIHNDFEPFIIFKRKIEKIVLFFYRFKSIKENITKNE